MPVINPTVEVFGDLGELGFRVQRQILVHILLGLVFTFAVAFAKNIFGFVVHIVCIMLTIRLFISLDIALLDAFCDGVVL